MFCPKCGSQNADSVSFCSYCGTPTVENKQPIQQPATRPGHGMAVASLVLGIIGLVLIGLLFGILAIIFGRVAMNQGYKGGKAKAGVTLGSIAVVSWVIIIIGTTSLGFFPL